MAWTNPATVAAGDTLAAAFWNEQVRDNSAYLKAEADAVGAVFVGSTTFTAAASFSLNNVFSAAYQNYLVVMQYVASAETSANIRLRVGGLDNDTASSYTRERLISASGAVTGANVNGAEWATSIVANANQCTAQIILTRVAEAIGTGIQAVSVRSNAVAITGGFHNHTVAYDGMTLTPAAGTFTGVARVYGMRNA